MAIFSGFIGPSYKMNSLPIDAQRCINWYPEKQQDENALSLYVLQPTPGRKQIIEIIDPTLPTGSFNRGMYRCSRGLGAIPDSVGAVITVIGPNVYEIKPDDTYSKLGVISNAISKVSMIDDGFGLIIVDGISMYRLDLKTKVFSNVSFTLTDPSQTTFLGGYTLVIGTKTNYPQGTVFWSNQYDDAVWNALNYATAEADADPITAITICGSYVHMYGPNSYELWSETGDKDLPFQRAYFNKGLGIRAPKSLSVVDNATYFIGSISQGGAKAYMSTGTDMKPISTLALEKEWATVDVSDATSWVYSDEGHTFWIVNFDTLDKTYVYDIGQGEWHERATRDPLTDVLHRWSPNYCIQRNGEIIVGDRYSTKLFRLSSDYMLEDGYNVLRIRTSAHVRTETKMFIVNKVRMDMAMGSGISDEEPARYTQAGEVMFRYSDDYGNTWSNEEREGFGATGEYTTMVEYRRLGRVRQFTAELKISDPAKTAILGAFIDIEVSRER